MPNQKRKRNASFVFILGDDLGYGNLSCYGSNILTQALAILINLCYRNALNYKAGWGN